MCYLSEFKLCPIEGDFKGLETVFALLAYSGVLTVLTILVYTHILRI